MKIKRKIYDKIIAHAKEGVPIEVCGYLASQNDIICKHYPLTNVDDSADHYTMKPEEQFATVKDARANGFEVGGIYHSHPLTVAQPSAEDIRLAYDPNISYVIISLADGGEDVKSFKIKDGQVTPEDVKIVG